MVAIRMFASSGVCVYLVRFLSVDCWVSTMCAKILRFSRVGVSIRVSLVLVCASTLSNNVAPSVESLVFAMDTSGRNRSQCLKVMVSRVKVRLDLGLE